MVGKFVLFGLLLLGLSAQALDYSVTPAIRSYPTSGAVVALARHDLLLWDQRSQADWKYGFIQPLALLSTHGQYEVGMNVYPVSFLEIGAGYGETSRYYNTKPFDCSSVVCQGILERTRLTSRLVAAYDFGPFQGVGIASYNRIHMKTGDDSKPFVDEIEVLLGAPGSDNLESGSLLLGAKCEAGLLGVLLRRAHMLESDSENESQYLVFRKKTDALAMSVGLGRYTSDFQDAGFSFIAAATWSWGESLSLF
jgi:hypothetical protein